MHFTCIWVELGCVQYFKKLCFKIKCWSHASLSKIKVWKVSIIKARQLAYLSSSSTGFYCNLDSSSTARWINQHIFCLLDSFLIAIRSIEVYSIAPWPIEPALLWTPGHLSIAASIKAFKAQHLARYLSTPQYVEIYWGSINRFLCDLDFISSIFLDLSVAVHLPNTLLSPLNLFLMHFFKLNQVFPPLVSL